MKQWFRKNRTSDKNEPLIIPREQHPISRKDIHPNAVKVLYRLKQSGFAAYLVGGGIRDLLIGLKPKDFDVVTDARPEQVKPLFRRCFLIGRRFRLAHVHFGFDKVEVATFRASSTSLLFSKKHFLKSKLGMVVRDNVYGTIEEDAYRRDLTINALYYNIADFSLVDYCGGLEDITNKIIRIIGDPLQRYHEDPVRLLRVIRFAAKLNFSIEEKTEALLYTSGMLLQHIPPARLLDEIQKFFLLGFAVNSFKLLQQYQLLKWLLAQTDDCLTSHPEFIHNQFIHVVLKNMDTRVREGHSVSAPFLFAALLWAPMMRLYYDYLNQNLPDAEAYEKAISKVLSQQRHQVVITRRISLVVHEIWHLQHSLVHRSAHAAHLIHQKRFRAGFDFLMLRAQAGEPLEEEVKWWDSFQVASDEERERLLHTLPPRHFIHHTGHSRRKKRRFHR